MPESWYSFRGCSIKDDDTDEIKEQKRLNQRIVAERKPYFMVYVYPALRHEYRKYVKSNQIAFWRRFAEYSGTKLDDLDKLEDLPKDLRDFLDYYKRFEPVGRNKCIVNQICYLFEDKFDKYIHKKISDSEFDYSILKSGIKYSKNLYYEIAKVYDEYTKRLSSFAKKLGKNRIDAYENWLKRENIVQFFKMECYEICSNEDELCDIVVDLCYKKEGTKQFAWDICGNIIIRNLLRRNDYIIHYPELDVAGEFEYCGEHFTIKQKKVENLDDDYIE